MKMLVHIPEIAANFHLLWFDDLDCWLERHGPSRDLSRSPNPLRLQKSPVRFGRLFDMRQRAASLAANCVTIHFVHDE
jgi:hypothetical protein